MPQRLISTAFATLLGLACSTACLAQVSVSEPWVRATTSQQKATGAFMQLQARTPTTLVSVRSPVAGVVEIHEMATEGGVMKMRALPNGLPLPAGAPVMLQPGGYHVMLMDLKAPVGAGEKVPLTLVFENDKKQRQEQKVEAEVRPLNSDAHSHH